MTHLACLLVQFLKLAYLVLHTYFNWGRVRPVTWLKQKCVKLVMLHNKFMESDNKFMESDNKFTESDNKFTESDNKFTESDNKFTESDNKFTEFDNKFMESDNVIMIRQVQGALQEFSDSGFEIR
jgi:hypothetical protein